MVRIASRGYVPTTDSASNVTFLDVIGNKTDGASSGDSLISLTKKNNVDILVVDGLHDVPTQNLATNATMAQVVGNKTDTAAGTSLMGVAKKIDAATQAGASSGTFSYLDAGGEQTVIEVTPTTAEIVHGIWLDLVNMTQNGTIKVYYKIDGTNYREIESFSFTVATDSDGFYIDRTFGFGPNQYKVTYTEGADEGAARNIPYKLIREKKVLT